MSFNSDSEKWARFRQLGRTQYVVRYGVLGWGVPTAIVFSLIQSYRSGWDTLPFHLIPALIIFPLAGIAFGRCMWKMRENKHAKLAATGEK